MVRIRRAAVAVVVFEVHPPGAVARFEQPQAEILVELPAVSLRAHEPAAAVGIRIGTALIVGVGALDVELRDDEGLVAAPHGEVGHEAGFGLPAGVVVDRHHVAVAGAGFDDALRIFAPVVEARSEDQVLRVGFADGLARDLEIVVGDGRAEFLAVGFGDGLRRGDALLRP